MSRREEGFGPAEMAALAEALPVARELTGHYFALADDWFEATSHQICTLRELRGGEVLGQGYLAQIRRVFRILGDGAVPRPRCRRLCPHYRICLQDHNLLRRRSAGLELPELLTCVLTHEYVHLVRFQRLEHPYRATAALQPEEEARVERIAADILQRLGHEKLRRSARSLTLREPSRPPVDLA